MAQLPGTAPQRRPCPPGPNGELLVEALNLRYALYDLDGKMKRAVVLDELAIDTRAAQNSSANSPTATRSSCSARPSDSVSPQRNARHDEMTSGALWPRCSARCQHDQHNRSSSKCQRHKPGGLPQAMQVLARLPNGLLCVRLILANCTLASDERARIPPCRCGPCVPSGPGRCARIAAENGGSGLCEGDAVRHALITTRWYSWLSTCHLGRDSVIHGCAASTRRFG